MKKNQTGFIIPVVIVLIAALTVGGGVYYAKKKQAEVKVHTAEEKTNSDLPKADHVDENKENDDTLKPQLAVQGNLSSKMTLQQLLEHNTGKDLMCSGRAITQEGVVIESTTYVSNGLVRGDNTTTFKGNTTHGSLIFKNSVLYTWSGNQGMKVVISESFDLDVLLKMNGQGSADINYTCTQWNADQGKFILPSSVHFSDLGSVTVETPTPEMMDKFMNGDFDF